MLNDKLKYRELYIYFALILMLTIYACLGFLTSQQVAFADYQDVLDDPTAIVNFNQLSNWYSLTNEYYNFGTIDTNGYSSVSLTNTSIYWAKIRINSTSNVIDTSHKVYIVVKSDKNTTFVVGNMTTNVNYDFNDGVGGILTGGSDYRYSINWFNDSANRSGSIKVCVMLIDLTFMFGSGNEPTLQQCQELFVADYYAYNTGTPLSFDTIQAYNNGVNAYAGNTQLHLSTSDFINSVYSVNVNNDYLGYGTSSGVQYDVLEKYDTYIKLNGGDIYSITNAEGTICLPFVTEISANTQVTITGQASSSQYNEAVNVGFYYYINGVMHNIGQFVCGTQSRYNSNTITFTTPFALDRIYIACDYNVNLRDIQVGYYVTDIELLKDSSYKNGYAKAEEEYKAYYSQGGAGYQAIYNAGYYAYPEDDHFTFQSLIASAVDVPVQAFINLFDFEILGINMKTLYASLLTLLVIVCIVRLVL